MKTRCGQILLSLQAAVWASPSTLAGIGGWWHITNEHIHNDCYLTTLLWVDRESRSAMNTSAPATKVGLLDLEINQIAKVLFGLLLLLSTVMVAIKGFKGIWPIYFFRYITRPGLLFKIKAQ